MMMPACGDSIRIGTVLALEDVYFFTATGPHTFEATFSILKIQPINIMLTVTLIFRPVCAVINIPSFLRS